MEQYEKWFEKEGKESLDSYQNHYSSIKEIMGDAWRAALKWVDSNKSYDMSDEIYDELNYLKD